MLKTAYLILCVVGTVLPLSQFSQFLLAERFNVNAFFGQLFANDVSSFLGCDLIVSSLVLWLFVFTEGLRLKMKNLWVYVASNLVLGVSLALPLFLLMRHRKIEATSFDSSH